MEKMGKGIEGDEALVVFLDSLVSKSAEFVRHFDTQINILIGIDIAIFAFSVSQIPETQTHSYFSPLFLYTLALFSMLSAICALYAIHPPRFMRKKGQVESLLYNKKVIGFGSPDRYAAAIGGMIKSRKLLIETYSTETYNIYKYWYRPKRVLFKISRDLLMLGLAAGVAIYAIQINF